MAQSPREVVRRALMFEYPERVPRDLWVLPGAAKQHGEFLRDLARRFPGDITGTPNVYRPSTVARGDLHARGRSVDEWGVVWENLGEGHIGEVKQPIVSDLDDWRSVRAPCETLPEDERTARDAVNRSCAGSERFVKAGCCPRPWERYQFLRGTVDAMMDVMDPDERVMGLLSTIHEFYMRELEFWVTTDVDAIGFMDDWGSQRQLLIPPRVWRDLFRPLYRDYCDIAHTHGKFAFMHSDGHITEIYQDLVDVGVDALNSQLFCMDMAELACIAKGKMTFWGEIDRQHVLNDANPEAGRRAVRRVAEHLYDPAGGVIAQFEFGIGNNPDVAVAVYEEWERIGRSTQSPRR